MSGLSRSPHTTNESLKQIYADMVIENPWKRLTIKQSISLVKDELKNVTKKNTPQKLSVKTNSKKVSVRKKS